MFSDKNASEFPSVGFPSDWRKTISLKEGSCQTVELTTSESEAQTRTSEESGCQTDEMLSSSAAAAKNASSSDDNLLLKFLARAAPMLERELESALRSRAFDGYGLIEDDGEEADKTVRKLHLLDAAGKGGSTNDRDDLMVSALTWSSIGAVIAVAYERSAEHDQWCGHETSLCVWNVARRDFDPGTPHQQIPAPTCLTDAKFHPKDPGFIVAGGFTGQIFVWAVSAVAISAALGGGGKGGGEGDDPLVAASAMQGHRERITALQWVLGDSSSASMKSNKILSSALDGKMILWAIDSAAQLLRPTRAFLIQAEHLPRSLKVRARSQTEVGITCTALNSEDKDIVMIGTEAGVIFQGSLSSEAPVVSGGTSTEDTQLGDDVPWRDPVSVTFSPHRGRVVDLKCSPFHRDIFLSVGSDQEIRIYSLLSPHTPAHVIYQEDTGLSSAEWSPARPMVLAVTAVHNSSLRVFDLMLREGSAAGAAVNVCTVKSAEKPASSLSAMTAIGFSGRGRAMVAAGDAAGKVHVWKLSGELSSAGALEAKGLEVMAVAAAVAADDGEE